VRILLKVDENVYTYIEGINEEKALQFIKIVEINPNVIAVIDGVRFRFSDIIIGSIDELEQSEEYIHSITLPVILWKKKPIWFVYCLTKKIVNYKFGQVITNSKSGFRYNTHKEIDGYYHVLGAEPGIKTYEEFIRNITQLLSQKYVIIYKLNEHGEPISCG